jgi:hypothetical protein
VADRIYVQIPAYRDRELLPTLRDLFRQARSPHNLRVAVAWQYHPAEETIESALRATGPIELDKIPAAESQGCNWARQRLQRRWDGERYTLFLDSHHRFAPGWDRQLVRLLEDRREAGSARPILTSYLPPYRPDDDPAGREHSILRIRVHERRDGMAFRLIGHPVRDAARLTAPIAAHFASLHCLFADGTFNEDLPFDPSIYFFADEIAIALRAYTRGYDLFHPHRVLGWHLYDRATRTTHWDDHADADGRDAESLRTLRRLFTGKLVGASGLGTVRSLADYERHIGLRLVGDDPWARAVCAGLQAAGR